MSIFFTSDTHFGHKNVIGYCKRPYENTDDMDEDLIARWNAVVLPEDIVYHLGDFSLNKTKVKKITPRLNGIKKLIAGNHDKCWTLREKYVNLYREAGWQSTQRTLQIPIFDNNTHIALLSHLPYKDMFAKDKRYHDEKPIDDGNTWLLHGHVHQGWKFKGKQINVGVDVWDLAPVPYETIAKIIRENPNGIYPTLLDRINVRVNQFCSKMQSRATKNTK